MIFSEAIDFNVTKYRTEDDALTSRGMLANWLFPYIKVAIPVEDEVHGVVYPVRQFNANPVGDLIPFTINADVVNFWRGHALLMEGVAGLTDVTMGGLVFEARQELGGICIVEAVKRGGEETARAAAATELFDELLIRQML